METIVKARRMGGSIGVLLPKKLVQRERISINETLTVRVERADDLTFLWGTLRNPKRPTADVLQEITESETYHAAGLL